MRVMEGGKRNKAVRDQGRRWRETVVGFFFYHLTNTEYLLNVSTVLNAGDSKVNLTAGPTLREFTI